MTLRPSCPSCGVLQVRKLQKVDIWRCYVCDASFKEPAWRKHKPHRGPELAKARQARLNTVQHPERVAARREPVEQRPLRHDPFAAMDLALRGPR